MSATTFNATFGHTWGPFLTPLEGYPNVAPFLAFSPFMGPGLVLKASNNG
jgi:hypothetical protein